MLAELESMSVDELWTLRGQIDSVLCFKMTEERDQLDRRLRQLKAGVASLGQAKRQHAIIRAKYFNPARPSETWTGRGRQPRWLMTQLKSGKKLEDFRIQAS